MPLNGQGNSSAMWFIDVTSKECLPVSETLTTESKTAQYVLNNVFFFDVSKSVSAGDFEVPSYCSKEAQAEENTKILAFARKAFSFSLAAKIF